MPAAVIYATDLSAMRAFFEPCFEMVAQQPDHEGFCVLDSAGWQLTLVRVPGSIAATIVITDLPRRRESSAVKLVFDVSDLDATKAAILAAGGHTDPATSAWKFQDRVHQDVLDPEGNVIQLRQRLPV